jgi:hypothetical protein
VIRVFKFIQNEYVNLQRKPRYRWWQRLLQLLCWTLCSSKSRSW